MHIRVSSWSLSMPALLAIYAAQIALLVSPAVYQHTRPNTRPDQRVVASTD
jgi:hypothetical protein